jgi:hypothetical protein
MDVKKETCKVTCGFKQNPTNTANITNTTNAKSKYDFKIISIVLFGIVIALSLVVLRKTHISRSN